MTSREIVKRAIHFQDPPRIPYNYDSNRTPVTEHFYGDDFIWCFLDPLPNQNLKHDIFTAEEKRGKNTRVDEWGTVWETMGDGSFGEAVQYAYEDVEDYASRPLPDFLNPVRYETMKKIAQENKGEKYLMGMLPHGLFQCMIDLFGFEGFMMEMAGNQEEFVPFLDKMCEDCIGMIHRMADAGMDGIIIIEDMGLQHGLMISPAMWRELYAPRFTKMFAAAHSRGMDVISHTCGHIVGLLDDYIACGLDVIQMDQQENMGLEVLSERFRGNVCFFCSLDIQRTVHFNREEIFQRCDDMVRLLATEHGGFMAKTYPQPEAVHITHEYMQNEADGFAAASKKYVENRVI